MKKTILLIAVMLLYACSPEADQYKSDVPVSRPSLEARAKSASEETSKEAERAESALPESINLDGPFYPQAPDADWSMPWQEACEEASITLAYHYFSEEPLSKEQFKKDVLGLVDWQNEHVGSYEHSTVQQTTQMLEGYFGFTDYQIMNQPSIEELKRELARGHVLVAPFAGRMLKNPFYSGQGPYYHMLVIKGYDSENFITNDVGTRRGENFIYPHATLMGALHDYQEPIEDAPASVIVFR